MEGQSRVELETRVHHVKGTANSDAGRIGIEPGENGIGVLMRHLWCVRC